MTRFKRRMLIGTALVVLVLFGLVLFFYRPTRVALERAEAFRFRRMLVTRLGEQNAYRFFYVTNRRLVANDGPLEERFGNKREGVLKYGSFDTVIEPSLGLGMIITISGRSLLKGIIAALFGLMITVIGFDPLSGVPRFTFGSQNLLGGVTFIPALIEEYKNAKK